MRICQVIWPGFTVSLLLRHAKSQGWLTLEDLSHLDNATFSKGLMKPNSPSRDVTFKMPDYEHVHAELAKPHVTLKLLWEEYVEKCRGNSDRFYMETQFRRYYHKFARVHNVSGNGRLLRNRYSTCPCSQASR